MQKEVIISVKTILITLGILLGLYITYELRGILSILFVALLLVISLEPAVKYLSNFTVLNRPLSRSLAVLVTYAAFILVVVFAFTTAVPLVVSQSQRLVNNFSFFLTSLEVEGQTLFESLSFLDVLAEVANTRNVSNALLSSLSIVSSILTLVVISIYMSLDWPNIKERFFTTFKKEARRDVREIIESIETHVGAWVKGQLLLMLAVGSLSFFGYLLIGLNYPLALGFIAGVLEIVPLLGPFFTAVIVTAVGFTDSSVMGFLALGVSILVQQLENNFLTPKIMQKVSGFSPLVILIALLIGSEFFGIVGAILAVPITMILGILIKRFLHYPTLRD
jgi:predicted PurR-regulated permease PerM